MMVQQFSTISSHSQFQKLREIIIGGVYPDSFFNHLDNQTQDIMCTINEFTSADLNRIKKLLEKFDIHCIEPKFTHIDDYIDSEENIIRPPITPCDYYLALGDNLYVIPQYETGVEPFQHAIDLWRNNNQKVIILDRSKPDAMVWCSFASVVRLGRDIVLDYDPSDETRKHYNLEYAKQLSEKYRVHVSNTGDHLDSVFCPLKPGLLLSSHYHTNTDFFKGWEVIELPNNLHINKKHVPPKANWWLPGVNYAHYNPGVLDVASKWLGNPVETAFDVNNLVIDEHNIAMSHCDDATYNTLQQHGINVHIVELKTKFFWDAGLHCLTRDIHREGKCEDYWPERPPGIDRIQHWQ